MELEFKPERLTIIKRLRGLSVAEIDAKMNQLSGGKNSNNLDRWEKIPAKRDFEKVKILAKATEVPVGFYYYKRVDFSMHDNWVEIYIPDTAEKIRFPFIPITE